MRIRLAKREDATFVAAHLREADRLELERLGTDASSVVASFDASDIVRTIEHDGRPVALFGRAPASVLGAGARLVWLLATPELDAVERSFVLACKPELLRLRRDCDQLVNLTHRGNSTSLRWLRWLEFNIDEKPCGPGGEFVRFWLDGTPSAAKELIHV